MARAVDLRSVQTVALSLADEAVRRESVATICNGLGLNWRMLDAVACKPGWIGCGLSHLRALRLSPPGEPMLILEDDVGVTEAFSAVIDVPDDADAVYLGATIYGAVDIVDYVGFTNMLLTDEVDERLLRIYNMLSTHAILYLSDRFKQATADSILHTMVDLGWEHDKGMARLQEEFVVYALRRPMFFQAAALQAPNVGRKQEDVTNITVEPPPPGAVFGLELGDKSRAAQMVREGGQPRWRWREEPVG